MFSSRSSPALLAGFGMVTCLARGDEKPRRPVAEKPAGREQADQGLARTRTVSAMLVGVLAFATLTTSLRGAEPKQDNKGPLAALPSNPGPHLEKIKALGNNEWVNLGAPAADPKWGKARGRSWGAKAFAFVPDRRGAFFAGEGVHGFVKPDGYHMDDLWFYDINAHRWICLYPGMNTKTFTQRVKDKELAIDGNGLLRDKDGQVIPVHTMIHAFGSLAYDSDRKKFAFFGTDGLNRYYQGGIQHMEEGMMLIDEQLKGKKKSAYSPWFYDAASGKFERSPAKGAPGRAPLSFPQVHYIPARKQFLVVGAAGVAVFDPAKNEWTELNPKGPAPKGIDGGGCYDSKRNRIYRNDGSDAGVEEGLMAFDIKSNSWSHLKPKGTPPVTKAGNDPQVMASALGTNGACYEYDPVLDLVVVIQMTGATRGVHTYNPTTNSWADRLPFPKGGPAFKFAGNTCYDPELNVYFCHVAGDSEDDGVVWAYRYKKRD